MCTMTVPASYILAKDDDDEMNFSNKSRRNTYNFIADVVEEVSPSIVKIELKPTRFFGHISNGSGFIISPDGVILTNAHVVQDYTSRVTVELYGGQVYNGKVVKIDKSIDLALIKIDCVRNLITKSDVMPEALDCSLFCL